MIAKRNNPNLERLNELARAGKSDLNVAVADLFPQINLSTYRNRTGANPSDALPTRFTGLQATWDIAENLGFARPLAIRQAKSNMVVARANLEQGQRLLQQNIVNTHISIQGLKQTVQAAWDNLRATQAAYAQASGRLQEGVGTNVELQLALTNLATARSNLATAFFNYNRLEIAQLFNLGVVNTDTIAKGYKP
jgi:outer membrane protein TolC